MLHQAVTVVALELLRRRVADDTERRLAGDVLSAMVSGELAGSELAGGSSRSACASASACSCSRRRARSRRSSRTALSAALRDEVPGGLAAGTGRFSCALLPLERGEATTELFALAERVRARVSREAGMALAGRRGPRGRGRRPAARVPRGALRARGAGARPARPTATARRDLLATYRDLGSFQLLLSLQDDDALRLFCDSILAPIEDGEGAYGGELMRSLEAFIECNGQWERAARQLYCHRHTLRYRIRRVEELTGPVAGLRARPDRLLARPARPRAGVMTLQREARSAT